MKKSVVGVIGLGQMGRAVARRLCAGGYKVRVYNRTRSRADSLLQIGARLADSPRALAEAVDVVITLVSNDEALEAVAYEEAGFADSITVGKTYVDMSTLTEGAIKKVQKRVAKAGGKMLHAPILGGPLEVFTGNATIVAGGAKSTFQSVVDILECISKPVHLVGGTPAHGTRMKMALNIMLAHYFSGIASSLAFAERGDLPKNLVHEIVTRIAGNTVERLGAKMLSDEHGLTFSMNNFAKDLSYFIGGAEKLGLDLPTLPAIHGLIEKAVKAGHGDEDFTALYQYMLEKE